MEYSVDTTVANCSVIETPTVTLCQTVSKRLRSNMHQGTYQGVLFLGKGPLYLLYSVSGARRDPEQGLTLMCKEKGRACPTSTFLNGR